MTRRRRTPLDNCQMRTRGHADPLTLWMRIGSALRGVPRSQAWEGRQERQPKTPAAKRRRGDRAATLIVFSKPPDPEVPPAGVRSA